MRRWTVFALISLFFLSPVPSSSEAESVSESGWNELERGPLPRWRLGPNGENATPSPDPTRPPVPRPIQVRRFDLAPDACPIASPPEYEPVDGVLFRYSTGSWPEVVTDLVASLTADPGDDEIAYVIVADASQQASAESDFSAAGADLSKVTFFIEPTDSIWMRDYGPHYIWQGGADAIVDSHYYPGRPSDNFIPTLLADDRFVNPSYDMPLYYSGGNFQASADRQAFITELIYADNPGFTESFIAGLYGEYQGIDTLHVMSQLPTSVDGTGHIDMWFYLVDEDTVIISEFLPGSDPTAIEITDNAVPYMEDLGYEVFRTPAWNASHPQGPTHYTYTNAFRVSDRIFVPTFGEGDPGYVQYDDQAIAAWQQAAGSGVEIVPINAYDIIWAAGALHCIVMQVPRYGDPLPSACATSPYGGELLVPNSVHEITWTAADDGEVDTVDLYYSVDGGSTYPPERAIATGLADDGSYLWTVPEVETSDGRVKVVARDEDTNEVEAESETVFTFESAARHVYDFATGANVDKFAYGDKTASWSDVDGIRLPVSTPLSSADYPKLAASDAVGGDADANRYVSTMSFPGDFLREATHVFEFTIEEDPSRILDVGVVWEGYADDCTQMELYVWDYTVGQWCDGKGECGENRFMANFAGNRDEKLSAHIRGDFERYVDPSGQMTLLLYAERGFDRSFHDYVSVTVTWDECAGSDLDFDGYADGCDNCVATVNPGQANGDTDPYGDACDCAPSDGGAFAEPSEIRNVRILGDKTTLRWDSDAPNSGSETTYDVARGDVGEFPVGTGANETCSAAGLTEAELTGLEDPPAGDGHHYLVRGANVCAVGGYGRESGGDPRDTSVCP